MVMDSTHMADIQNKTKKYVLLKFGRVSGMKGNWHVLLVGLKPRTGTW